MAAEVSQHLFMCLCCCRHKQSAYGYCGCIFTCRLIACAPSGGTTPQGNGSLPRSGAKSPAAPIPAHPSWRPVITESGKRFTAGGSQHESVGNSKHRFYYLKTENHLLPLCGCNKWGELLLGYCFCRTETRNYNCWNFNYKSPCRHFYIWRFMFHHSEAQFS